jgi:Kef-type K+ transport system membrane component KefB
MPIEQFLITLIFILAIAKICGEVAERRGQPAVLGELIGGVLGGTGCLGQLAARCPALHSLTLDPSEPVLQVVAGVGVILLMFEVGLETDLDDLLRLGWPALWVAFLGVILPFAGGYFLMRAFGVAPIPSALVGASLTATSVGITARSFADLNCSGAREARLVLAAAVADDVIGLVILAAMAGTSSARGISFSGVARAAVLATLFLVAAAWLGRRFAPAILRRIARMRTRAALSTAALMFCFLLAVLAEKIGGLSPMVGAFAAGLILAKTEQKVHFEQRLKPVADIFVPVFFVMAGAAMPLQAIRLGSPGGGIVLEQAAALFAVAVAGKIVAGLTVPARAMNRLAVGVAMVPRGEVALIFASYGIAARIFSPRLYCVVLLVVMATTLLTPVFLKIVLRKSPEPLPGEAVAQAAS